MRDSRLAAITQLIIALAAIGSMVVSVYNARQIMQVHLVVDSRMNELLDVAKETKAEVKR